MKKPILKADEPDAQYQAIFGDVSRIVDSARQSAVRSVNAVMTAAYWRIGQRIVEFEQSGEKRAEYGTALIERLAVDMTERFGRGFSRQNIWQMRQLYLSYPPERILQTVSGESSLDSVASHFPLPWSAYVRLLSVKNTRAREFYETEALRGGWSVRQLDRQINSQFYERTALSKNKAAMLTRGRIGRLEKHPGDEGEALAAVVRAGAERPIPEPRHHLWSPHRQEEQALVLAEDEIVGAGCELLGEAEIREKTALARSDSDRRRRGGGWQSSGSPDWGG